MSDASLLSIGYPSGLLDGSDLTVDASRVRNITADVNNRLFPKIPKGSQVEQKHCCIVGKQGCGKTFLINALVLHAIAMYGRDMINLIYADDPRICLEKLDGRPVQLCIIDDATSNASSREVHKQTEILKAYNKSRHIFEKHLNGRPGVIVFIFGWQRWIELDPGFRDGHVLIFKTGMTGLHDRKDIQDKIGEDYDRILYRIWDRIDRGDNEIKGVSVARIAAKRPEDGGVGVYVSRMQPNVLPEIVTAEEFFKDDEAEIDILDMYRGKGVWDKRIRIYEEWTTGKYGNQTELARELGINQGRVSESIRKVQALLSKK